MRVDGIKNREAAIGSSINLDARLGLFLVAIWATMFTVILIASVTIPIILQSGVYAWGDVVGDATSTVVELWRDLV